MQNVVLYMADRPGALPRKASGVNSPGPVEPIRFDIGSRYPRPEAFNPKVQ